MTRSTLQRYVVLALATLSVAGCSPSSERDATSVGQSIGENVTDFARGVGMGVDKKLQVAIELSGPLSELGLSATVAKQELDSTADKQKDVSVYFLAQRKFEGTLVAKAYSADDQEIGRARTEVAFQDDDAQYVAFSFPAEMDRQLVAKYVIDLASKPDSKTESPE